MLVATTTMLSKMVVPLPAIVALLIRAVAVLAAVSAHWVPEVSGGRFVCPPSCTFSFDFPSFCGKKACIGTYYKNTFAYEYRLVGEMRDWRFRFSISLSLVSSHLALTHLIIQKLRHAKECFIRRVVSVFDDLHAVRAIAQRCGDRPHRCGRVALLLVRHRSLLLLEARKNHRLSSANG